MKPTSNETDRRDSDRRSPTADRREDIVRAVAGDRRVVEKRGEVEAMADALDDILRWERASERTIQVAAKANSGGFSN